MVCIKFSSSFQQTQKLTGFVLFYLDHVFQGKDKNSIVNDVVRVSGKRELFETRRTKPVSPIPFEELNTNNSVGFSGGGMTGGISGGIEFGKREGKDEDDSLWDSNNNKKAEQGNDLKGNYVVRLRGLPWQITEEDIIGFFSELVIVPGGIYFFRDSSGRPMGEGFVRFETKRDYEEAIKRHKNFIGKRYIEVFSSSMDEWNKSGVNQANLRGSTSSGSTTMNSGTPISTHSPLSGSRNDRNGHFHSPNNNLSISGDGGTGGGFVVRMRGLPYSVSIDDILNFFRGIDLGEDQIFLLTNHSGQITGDGYVNFSSAKQAERAMSLHNSRIGRRYIELFSSDGKELKNVLSRSGYRCPTREHLNRSRDRERTRYSPYREPDRGPRVSYSSPPLHNKYGDYRGPPGGLPQNPQVPIISSRNLGGGMPLPSGAMPHGSSLYPPTHMNENYILRLRGLPYSVTLGDIEDFFGDAEIIRSGIHLLRNHQGKLTGEAYVEFCSENDKRIALRKHNNRIGSRYIELFHASDEEFERYIGSSPNNEIRGKPSRRNYSPVPNSAIPPPYRSHHISDIDPALVRMLQGTVGRSNYDPRGPPPSINSHMAAFGGYSDPYMSQQPPPRYGYSPNMPPNSSYPPGAYGGVVPFQEEPSVVIRGLTAHVTVADIQRYFIGYNFIPDSIRVVSNIERTIFEATIQFASVTEAQRALKEKKCGYIGDSFIKLYDR